MIFSFQSTPPARGATDEGRPPVMTTEISIHAPREGGDVAQIDEQGRKAVFQSTPPARGATGVSDGGRCRPWHFNPRPPRGGRRDSATDWMSATVFQSTPPARGATGMMVERKMELEISIHAPREGGDCRSFSGRLSRTRISIHAPREGGDCLIHWKAIDLYLFQSTPPARGATGSSRTRPR